MKPIAATALALLALAGPSRADDPPAAPTGDPPATREEQWRSLRLARIDLVEPYRPTFLERQILAFEKAERPSVFQLNLFGFYPRTQSIATGSQQAGGVRFWRPHLGGSEFSVHGSALFSIAGYEFYDLQFGRLPHSGTAMPARSNKDDDVYELAALAPGHRGGLILYGQARYQHFPQETFYGLGAGTSHSDETDFLAQQASYGGVAGWQFGRHLAVTGRAAYLQAFVGRGTEEDGQKLQDVFDDAAAPGVLEQPDFLFGALQVFLDGRDVPGNPGNGAMLALQFARYHDRADGAFSFTRFSADARGFKSLGSPQRVLALRGYLSLDDPDDGARVPFYLQETLGGSHTLRGFESFRFRGEKLLLLQAEYRWYPAPALEMALFADAGQAVRTGTGFDLGRLDADVGVGLRLKTSESLLLRLDVAHGRESTRVLFRLGSAGF